MYNFNLAFIFACIRTGVAPATMAPKLMTLDELKKKAAQDDDGGQSFYAGGEKSYTLNSLSIPIFVL